MSHHIPTQEQATLKILINGKELATNDFVTKIFTNVISAMVTSLRTDEKEIHNIRIDLDMKGTL